jgi:hypothetical protein
MVLLCAATLGPHVDWTDFPWVCQLTHSFSARVVWVAGLCCHFTLFLMDFGLDSMLVWRCEAASRSCWPLLWLAQLIYVLYRLCPQPLRVHCELGCRFHHVNFFVILVRFAPPHVSR